MSFQTRPYIQRAREHIQSEDPARLKYACLELRYAIERITYQKLQLRLDKVTIDEIGRWQPRAAMDRLMALVDEHFDKDSSVHMAPEDEYGNTNHENYAHLGISKGVDPKYIGKYWQKLGWYLHFHPPKKKGETPKEPDKEKLKHFLKEVISYIEEITQTGFDAHFSENVTFACKKCDQSVVRNINLLNDNDIVQCQNPECNASYIAHASDNNFTFEPYTVTFTCKECGHEHDIYANALLRLSYEQALNMYCDKCNALHEIRWVLNYKLGESS